MHTQNNTSGIPKKGQERARRKRLQDLKIYGVATLLIAFTLYLTYQFVAPAPAKVLRLSAGNEQGAYYAYAQAYRAYFAQHGVTLEVLESQGSIDNLNALREGRADVALVQSGLHQAIPDAQGLEALGSVYDEPLWVFTRKGALPANGLSALQGKRLAVGPEGSGTRALALQLLGRHHIHSDNSPFQSATGKEAVDALLNQSVDAVFLVAAPSAPAVQTLLLSPDIELMSFRRAPAYALQYRFLRALTLPEGAVDLAENIPPQTVQLLAPSAMLVATDALHPALADLMLQAATAIHGKASFFTKAGTYPSSEYVDFPLSEDAERFYQYGPPFLQRYLPFWAATWVDRLKVMLLPLLALLIPLSKILPPTYRWSIRKRIYRWYDELQDVDDALLHTPSTAVLDEAQRELLRVEKEVTEIEVPLSYAQELYVLRQHIELLKRKVQDSTNSNTSPGVAI